MASSSSYVCDTLPAPRLATAPPHDDPSDIVPDDLPRTPTPPPMIHQQQQQQPPPRKLCVRHQRMADEGTNLKLQHVCVSPVLFCTFIPTMSSVP